jgi:hypothetical protein
MTCHEFRQAALALTLRELLRAQDEQVRQHAGDCRPCGDWLQGQRELVSGLQTLHHQTAGLEAGPHVERALLEVFRQGPRRGMRPTAALRSTPVALRLSRFFEIGAYVAVAAAIVVGLFLGFRIWQESAKINHATNQSTSPAIAAPAQPSTSSALGTVSAQREPALEAPTTAVLQSQARPVHRLSSAAANAARLGTAPQAPTGLDADYVALMFCDPLSCASDAQIVRMELPASAAGSQDEQTRIADVVVGDDGLVRAVRMVN